MTAGPTTAKEFQELFEDLKTRVGQELGVTSWFTVEQRDADLYSALIDDWDYMHNDPEWARPRFGGTIAHGLYTLSLIPTCLKQVSPSLPLISVAGVYGLNYGLDRVRFPAPWRIGQRARDRVAISDVQERPDGYMVKMTHTFELEDFDKPCMVAEHLILFRFEEQP
jgi:acyl dehydratase